MVKNPGNNPAPSGDTVTPTLVAESAPSQPASMAQQAQEQAGQIMDRAQGQAKAGIAAGKEKASGQLGSIAQVLRQTGQQLREQEMGGLGQFMDTAAQRMDQMSFYLRDRDVDQLVRETESLARRQPALFLGGAFALGLVAARFLKSSSPGPEYSRWSGTRPWSGEDAFRHPNAPASSTARQGP